MVRHHGDDPTLCFLLIDHYFLTGEYQKARDNLDQFVEFTGVKDGGYYFLVTNSYIVEEKLEEAAAWAEKGVEAEPEMEYSYWSLVAIYDTLGRYEEAVKAVAELERRFSYILTPDALVAGDMEGLAKSEACTTWRAANPPPGAE